MPSVLRPALVCFALNDEAAPFRQLAAGHQDVHIAVSGVGAHHAERCLRAVLAQQRPALVLTCGYAGALNPALAAGEVVFSAAADFPLTRALEEAGAQVATFHCSSRVATTAAEKAALRLSTGADAVEMESGIIQRLCRTEGIPCATVRAISDPAGEDLPLDFNALMKADQNLDFSKLTMVVLKSPGKIPALLRLRRAGRVAGKALARVLADALFGDERGAA